MGKYLISIDQSTQGTKALLLGEDGSILKRTDRAHRQIINEKGWVSHDPMEIYENVRKVVDDLTKDFDKSEIIGVGISNQRETTVAWDAATGEPIANAIVWQCSRSEEICAAVAETTVDSMPATEYIRRSTGLQLSPYFPASKMAWLIQNVEGASEKNQEGTLRLGTMDAWLVYKLTDGTSFKTDYSNASRTQLFDIFKLQWNEKICELFGINPNCLPEVCDSDSCFGETDFDGVLPRPVPIHGVLGDSHGALFGQNCRKSGMLKTTYGTGSSIMMNIGTEPVLSTHGLVTSLAWSMKGKAEYVLEGNLNYTGAVITWLKNDMELITSPGETGDLAEQAAKDDSLYLVPAFSGLGAPYWESNAKAAIIGMTRTTRRAELVRAGLECIAYQITDIIEAMREDSGIDISQIRVDGGPTKNSYLMQFQSDMSKACVSVSKAEELSALGAGYTAGLALGLWDESIFDKMKYTDYEPKMHGKVRESKYAGWKDAVSKVL